MSALTMEAIFAMGLVSLVCGALLVFCTFGYFTRRIERSNRLAVTLTERDNERTRTTVEGYCHRVETSLDEMRLMHANVLAVHETHQRSA